MNSNVPKASIIIDFPVEYINGECRENLGKWIYIKPIIVLKFLSKQLNDVLMLQSVMSKYFYEEKHIDKNSIILKLTMRTILLIQNG